MWRIAAAIIENHRIYGQPMGSRLGLAPRGWLRLLLSSMRVSGHIIGLLKEYMGDLVEQARQESQAQQAFGFSMPRYQPDHAIADLLSILDDRIESEGLQVGMPLEFLHEMWRHCNEARGQVMEQVWLETNLGPPGSSKARIRELTYAALITHLESDTAQE